MTEYLIRRNTVLEALRGSRRELFRLWLHDGLDKKLAKPLRQAANKRGVSVQTADKQKIGRLVKDHSHQGVALEVGPYVYSDVD
ncbi:MAG: 23S rRNA (guanosine(2251)-2'-O)-methyltransferase RlmB, partial [Chloroflexi bacterium]|nr:23S rRNA (guanosine(2251)-2'-O)-methyltransferase RlmB [Chloroflexota bacterium]